MSNKKFKINGKGRIYNQTKPSKILTKVVGIPYNKQTPKESKPTRRTRNVKEAPANSADILLKFDKHRRVDTNRFFEFEYDFRCSQKRKENTQIVELMFRIEVEIIEIDPDTGEQIGDAKAQTTEAFIEAETAYGGDVGLKLYIKMQLVNRLGDSTVYI